MEIVPSPIKIETWPVRSTPNWHATHQPYECELGTHPRTSLILILTHMRAPEQPHAEEVIKDTLYSIRKGLTITGRSDS